MRPATRPPTFNSHLCLAVRNPQRPPPSVLKPAGARVGMRVGMKDEEAGARKVFRPSTYRLTRTVRQRPACCRPTMRRMRRVCCRRGFPCRARSRRPSRFPATATRQVSTAECSTNWRKPSLSDNSTPRPASLRKRSDLRAATHSATAPGRSRGHSAVDEAAEVDVPVRQADSSSAAVARGARVHIKERRRIHSEARRSTRRPIKSTLLSPPASPGSRRIRSAPQSEAR